MPNNPLLVKIGGDTTEFQSSLAGLGSTLLKAVGDLNPIVAGLVGLFVGVGAAALDVGSKFEEASNTITRDTGATGASLDSLNDSFKNIYLGVPESAKTVSDAVAELNVRLGLTGPLLDAVTTSSLELARVTGEQAGPQIKSVTQMVNEWGIASTNVVGTQDMLLRVFQTTGTSVTTLASSLAEGAPILQTWGLSLQDSALILGNFEKNGLSAGTALSTLKIAAKNLEAEGITPTKEALTDLIDNLANIEPGSTQATEALALLGRGGVQVMQMAQSGKLDIDALTASFKTHTDTVADAANRTQTLGDMMGVLLHGVQSLIAPLGTDLLEALKGLVSAFGVLSGPIAAMPTWLQAIFVLLTPFKVTLELLNAAWLVLKGAVELTVAVLKDFVDLGSSVIVVAKMLIGGNDDMTAAMQKGTVASQAFNKTQSETAAATAQAAIAVQGETKAHQDILAAVADHKAAKELLKKATEDINAAESTLAEAYKALFIPTIFDAADAENSVLLVRNLLQTDIDTLKSKENDLKAMRDSGTGSAASIKKAEDDLTASRKQVKADTELLKQAESDLKTSRDAYTKATTDLAAAENDISSAYKTLHIPTIVDVTTAENNVEVARQAVIDQLAVVKTAEADLETMRDSGKATVADLKVVEDNLKQTRVDLKTATDNYKQSQSDLNTTTALTTKSTQDLYAAQKDLDAFHTQNLTPHSKDVTTAFDDLRTAYDDASTAAEAVVTAEDDLKLALAGGDPTAIKEATVALTTARNDLKVKNTELHTSEGEVSTDFGLTKTQIDNVKKSTDDSTVSIGAYRTAALAAYKDVMDKAIDAGTAIPADQQIANAKMIQQQKDFSAEHLTQWTDLYNSIDKTVSGTADSMIKTLITGTGSFHDEMIKGLEDIGVAVVEKFTKPFTDAIANLIATGITKLLSSSGLGGISTALDGIIGKISSAAGSTATSAAGAVGTAATGSGEVGSATGDISSAVGAAGSSVMGMVNMISGIVTAVASVVQIFQNMNMASKMASVEENTRYTQLYLGGRSDQGILGILFKIDEELAWGNATKDLDTIKDLTSNMRDAANLMQPDVSLARMTLGDIENHLTDDIVPQLAVLNDIQNNTQWVTVGLQNIATDIQVLNTIAANTQYITAGLQNIAMDIQNNRPVVNVTNTLDGQAIVGYVTSQVEYNIKMAT